MTKQRRSFTAEFKQEAAALVLDQGYSHIEASCAVSVGESVLRRWVNQLRQERDGVTPQSKALTPEQQKIQELEARINRLEQEKAILKNVWSAPDLQVRIRRRQKSVCANVSGLFMKNGNPSGLDGIRTHRAS